MVTPIFLISLPRSGSTLLQKMLAVSNEISSAAEPWIMLPMWSMRQLQSGRSVYSHHTAARAINDFVNDIPGRDEVFHSAVRKYAETLYRGASKNNKYFLDKTPRYYLIISFLREVFPEARFVFLLRNPLAVLASIGQTFYGGRFLWTDYRLDWFLGNRCLSDELLADEQRFIVRYEDLVEKPEKEIEALCRWLDVPFDTSMISDFRSSKWDGRMGDPTGIRAYASVSQSSLKKWHQFYASDFRKKIARKMLQSIGDDVLGNLGYPMSVLYEELTSINNQFGFDLSARSEYMANRLASRLDYRYLKARYDAMGSAESFVMGYVKDA